METIQSTHHSQHNTLDELRTRMRALFRTMADFYNAAPWTCASLADHLIGVTIPDLGVRQAAVVLLGGDLPPGFFVFACADDIDRLSRETAAHRRGFPATCPSLVSLTFEPSSDQGLRDRIDRDRLELAAPDAFPFVARLDGEFQRGRAEPLDVVVACAIAAAMAAFVMEDDADAWRRGKPIVRTVKIHLGEIAISLRNADVPAPCLDTDILARLAELDRVTPADHFERISLEEELVRQFAVASKLRGLPSWFGCVPSVVLDAVIRERGATIASLAEPAFRKILFDVIPKLDVIDASQAYAFVDALFAFLEFLKLSHRLPQADALLRVVGAGAAERLESRIRAVSPGWVPSFPHAVDLAPPPARTDRAARRAKHRAR